MTIALAGPFATMLLAGLGARVIHVENPGGTALGAAVSWSQWSQPGPGRPRRSVDGRPDPPSQASSGLRELKQPGARELLHDLIAHSDVVVDNFSRGTVGGARLRFSVHARGESADRAGVIDGLRHRGRAGHWELCRYDRTGTERCHAHRRRGIGPTSPTWRPLGDTITPLCLIIGILSALEHVRFTGVGERVDASMVGALTALVAIEPFDLLKSMGVPYRTGPTMARLGTFGLYQCAEWLRGGDGRWRAGGCFVSGDRQTRSWSGPALSWRGAAEKLSSTHGGN